MLLAIVRKMFNWAVASDYLEVSPAAGMKPPGKAVRRDRVLSRAELRTIWTALPWSGLSPLCRYPPAALSHRPALRRGLRHDALEIDLDRALWNLPKTRTKNGQAHSVPLSDQRSPSSSRPSATTTATRTILCSPASARRSSSTRSPRRSARNCTSSTGTGARTTPGGPSPRTPPRISASPRTSSRRR